MSLDPKTFGSTPEARAADIGADLDRRLRALEQRGATTAYAEGGYVSNADTANPVIAPPSASLYVPDVAGTVIEIFVTTRMQVSGGGTSRVQLGLTDGSTTQLVTVLSGTGAAYSRYVALPGSTVGTQSFHGGWLLFPIDYLKSLGLTFDKLFTVNTRFVVLTAGLAEWSETHLWVRIR